MSFVIAAPELISTTATDLANIGSTLSTANAAAAATTTEVVAAGADEVSAAVSALFGAHGQAYQAVSAQAAAFHAQFVQALNAGAGSYAAAEAANALPAQSLEEDLLGRDQCAHPGAVRAPADRQRRQRARGQRADRAEPAGS